MSAIHEMADCYQTSSQIDQGQLLETQYSNEHVNIDLIPPLNSYHVER